MDILSAILLGVIQGITEWLPISSAAHMALANILLGLDAPIEFQVALNFGTIAALVAYTRKDLYGLATGILSRNKESLRLLSLIIIAGVPTAIIGFLGKAWFEEMHLSLMDIGITLVLNGILLFLTLFAAKGAKMMGSFSAFAQGIGQGLSVAPGISRSGATISAAIFLGVKPEEAAKFSFLIGIPAILIASAIETVQATSLNPDLLLFAIGISVSGIIGYLTIGVLMSILKQGKFHLFSYYCIILGLIAIILSF